MKKLLAVILSMGLVFGAMDFTGVSFADITKKTALAEESARGVNVTYHTQDEIRNYIARNGATVGDPLTYAEVPTLKAPYAPGKLSQTTQESAIAMLNQIRYIAGLSGEVSYSEEQEKLVQAAALVNYANGELSHFPAKPEGMSDELYALGAKGASSANISWGSWEKRGLNDALVHGWMNDGDAGNISRVGHRRWLLNPSMSTTGFGAVDGDRGTYSAVYAFDRSNVAASEYGVMWPAQNMPVEYFNRAYPWSISMGSMVDEASVQVTLTRCSDNQVWNFSAGQSDGEFYVNNDLYGQEGCIIFRPSGGGYSVKAGDSYRVEIQGLQETVSYSVNFFGLSGDTSTSTEEPSDSDEDDFTEDDDYTEDDDFEFDIEDSDEDSDEDFDEDFDEDSDDGDMEDDYTEDDDLEPTKAPTLMPTVKPTSTPKPTPTPTVQPTEAPTLEPVPIPVPTVQPTEMPSPDNGKFSSVGTKFFDVGSGANYKITKSTKGTKEVAYTKRISTRGKSVAVPDTAEYEKTTYKVTAIDAKAFKNQKKITKITIGKNVTAIGKEAFATGRHLKQIKIYSKKLKKDRIAKKAFKGITKQTVIYAPKAKVKSYTKIFRQKGLSRKVRIRSF